MADLSKFYKVTNQIMIEYIANLYTTFNKNKCKETNYTIYTGKDDNVYYTETPIDDTYANSLYFIKYPDESDSEYTYLGLLKECDKYISSELNKNFINGTSDYKNGLMLYDKIRVHLIYGFTLDKLAGFTLLVKTNARCLCPILKTSSYSVTHKLTDDDGNPIFEETKILYEGKEVSVERLVYDEKEFCLLDIFFPKECLHKVVNWHNPPLYLNGAFYDRYIEFYVPSAYFLSVDTKNSNLTISTPNKFGCDTEHLYSVTDENGTSYYALVTKDFSKRKIIYEILTDPTVIINFATVSEENLTVTDSSFFSSTFVQDPINQISLRYKSNSDYFNIRIYEDNDSNEIVYYPVFGEGENAPELNYDIFMQIEQGLIPLITEGFYDSMADSDEFYKQYGENAYKWIIYNDMAVTYYYDKFINPLDIDNIHNSQYTLNFTSIIDYGIPNPQYAGSFWKNSFIPKVPKRSGLVCSSILVSYTCRLVNRLSGVEAIRRATLTVLNPEKYTAKKIFINNVNSYKIINQIKRGDISVLNTVTTTKEKLIRSYYDATNLVIKDMSNNNTYSQGQMTLNLKHTSTNYVFRLYTLNTDNVRVPYDLTGPYRYTLVFPSADGNKIKIKTNADSTALNLGIGQLAFYITEDLVKRIMNVSDNERYFAIVTDTDNNGSNQSTLYEGKVNYYL